MLSLKNIQRTESYHENKIKGKIDSTFNRYVARVGKKLGNKEKEKRSHKRKTRQPALETDYANNENAEGWKE